MLAHHRPVKKILSHVIKSKFPFLFFWEAPSAEGLSIQLFHLPGREVLHYPSLKQKTNKTQFTLKFNTQNFLILNSGINQLSVSCAVLRKIDSSMNYRGDHILGMQTKI